MTVLLVPPTVGITIVRDKDRSSASSYIPGRELCLADSYVEPEFPLLSTTICMSYSVLSGGLLRFGRRPRRVDCAGLLTSRCSLRISLRISPSSSVAQCSGSNLTAVGAALRPIFEHWFWRPGFDWGHFRSIWSTALDPVSLPGWTV